MSNQVKASSKSNVIEQLNWRYATKKFDSTKKIDNETFEKIEKAMVLTPSSYGLQPWKFVVVVDQSTKQKLAEASFNQPQPKDCSHLVVITRLNEMPLAYVDKYLELIAQTREIPLDSLEGYKAKLSGFLERTSNEVLESWMENQCYIALGNLLHTAAQLGVDACPMEGFAKERYNEILQLEEKGVSSVVVCALGVRADDDKYAELKKVRHPVSDVVLYV